MIHVVSILDRVYALYPQADPTFGTQTNFYRDIYPILSRAVNYAWVSAQAYGPQGGAHGPGQPGDMLSKKNLQVFCRPRAWWCGSPSTVVQHHASRRTQLATSAANARRSSPQSG